MEPDVTNAPDMSGGVGMVVIIIYAAVAILMIASMWKVFTKAGKPGWAAIVPIYNLVVLLQIGGQPLWFLVLFIIPLANIFALFAVQFGIAKAFGKGVGFGIGLTLLGFIFYPILAFSDARYQGVPQKAAA